MDTRDDAETQAATLEQFNPFVPEFRLDPYPFYQRYRLLDPVHWGVPLTSGETGVWYVFRYSDAVAVFKDPRLIRDRRRLLPPGATVPVPETYRLFVELTRMSMFFQDPPEHTRLRSLVNKAFTPQAVAQLRPHIAQIAQELLETMLAQGGGDLVSDFAMPLPVTVIAELLGLPSNVRPHLREWTTAIAQATDLRPAPGAYVRGNTATQEFIDFLRPVLAERRRQPQADVISSLIMAEDNGGKLTEDELLSMCLLLLIGGHETTVSFIGNAVLALHRYPDQRQKLADAPELIENAVAELLRYDSPAQMVFRWAIEDMELAGKAIRKGQTVGVMLGAINHDPDLFPDPDRLELARPIPRQSAFGYGNHYCLGAPLAEAEGQIALSTLLHLAPNLRVESDTPAWRESLALRGLKELPVSF